MGAIDKFEDVFIKAKSVFNKTNINDDISNNNNIQEVYKDNKIDIIKIKTYNELKKYSEHLIVIDVFYDYSNKRILMYCKNVDNPNEKIYLDISELRYQYFTLPKDYEDKWDVFLDKKYLKIGFTKSNIADIIFNGFNELRMIRNKKYFNTTYPVSDKMILLFRQFQKFDRKFNPSGNENISFYNTLFFDIEVLSSEDEFPDENKSEHPISTISLYKTDKQKLVILVNNDLFKHKYNKEKILNNVNDMYNKHGLSSDDIEFHEFDNEKDMLIYFTNILTQYDVITAWNIQFDINYIYNRLLKLNLSPKLLSPFNSEGKYSKDTFYRVPGIITIDLLEIYKKYEKSKYYSYKLDAIAERELGYKKVSFDGSLTKLFNEEPDTYLLYSLIDSYLIKKIADVTGFIDLILSVKDDACVSYMNVLHDTFVILSTLYQFAFKENKAIASTYHERTDTEFPGAFVREPKLGLLHWVIDSDASSMYPSIMISLNVSPETLYAQILEDKKIIEQILFDRDNLKKDTIKIKLIKKNIELDININELYTKILESPKFKISPSGAIYIHNEVKKGLIPKALQILLDERKHYKDLMFKYIKENDELKAKYYDIIQSVKKIIANAFYGALGAKHFVFYYPYMAKSITLTGQYMNKFVSGILDYVTEESIKSKRYDIDKLTDELINDKNMNILSPDFIERAEHKQEYVFYSDTDSSFIHMEDLISLYLYNKYKDKYKDVSISDIKNDLINIMINDDKVKYIESKDEIISSIYELVDKFNYIIHNHILYNYAKSLKCLDNSKFKYKTEFIFRTVYFTKKKNYLQWIIEREGSKIDSIKSMQIGIRSSYPPITNDMIKELMIIIVREGADINIINNFINKWRNKFLKYYNEYREPKACIPAPFNKQLDEYKTYPDNVKAMMLYNMLTRTNAFKHKTKGFKIYFSNINYKKLGLNKKEYESIIHEFNKLYPDKKKTLFNRICIPVDSKSIPDWIEIDIHTMMDKTFKTPLQDILNPLNITVTIQNKPTFEGLF